MTTKELAIKLTEKSVLDLQDVSQAEEAKKNGLVIAFLNDDASTMFFRGAIHDEIFLWDGAKTYINAKGEVFDEQTNEDLETLEKHGIDLHFFAIECFSTSGARWLTSHDIPSETFRVLSNEKFVWHGMVFALKDALPQKKRP